MKTLVRLILLGTTLAWLVVACGRPTPPPPPPSPLSEAAHSGSALQIEFTASPDHLAPGACTTLQWRVAGPHFAVFLDDQEVADQGSQQVCPPETQPFFLRVDTGETVEERTVTVVVGEGAPPGGGSALEPETHESPGGAIPPAPAIGVPPGAPIAPQVADLTYATVEGEALTLDIYQPNTTGPAPTVIYIHGGGFTEGDKAEGQHWASYLVPWGYAVVSINYRLAPQHPFPAAIADVQCALSWVRAHAAEYVLDGEHMALIGSSAGGHLALLAALSAAPGSPPPAWQPSCGNGANLQVQAVVSHSGPTDLQQILSTPEGNAAVQAFIGSPCADKARCAQASPVTYVSADAPPVLLFHGVGDDIVPVDNARHLEAKLKAVGASVTYVEMQAGHVDPLNEDQLHTLHQFLDTHLQPGGTTQAPASTPGASTGPAYTAGAWTDLGGPPGGVGYDIRVNPENPQVWYVTDVAAGVSKSTDGGLTWFRTNQGIQADTTGGVPIFCLTMDPHDPQIIWAGTYLSGHLYRSTDGGQTWEQRDQGITHEGRSFRGITIDPNRPHTLYAAGEVSGWVFGGGEGVKGEVYRSDDDGAHWRLIWSGDNLARYVWVDPRDSNRIYVSTGIFDRPPANADPAQGVWGGVGILRSKDGGQTWEVLDQKNGLAGLSIPSLFMHPTNPDILIAAVAAPPTAPPGAFTQSGVYVTTNGGDTWQAVLTDPEVGMDAVEIATANPNVWYAAGHQHGNAKGVTFWRSDDAGQTWTKSYVHTQARSSNFAIDIQVDPRDPYRVFINNYGGGNFLSEDGGQTWVDASKGYTGLIVGSLAVAPWDARVVFVNGFRSNDGGDTWGAAATPDTPIGATYRFGPRPGSGGFPTIFSTSAELLYRSDDGGQTWQTYQVIDVVAEDALGLLTTGNNPMTLAIAPSNPQVLYAGFVHYDCLSDDYRQCVVPAPRFSRSHDGGRTWEQVSNAPFQGVGVISLTVAPNDPKTVYAGTGKGLFVSHDGGDTWQEITTLSQQIHQQPPSPEEYNQGGRYLVFKVLLDPFDANTLYVGIVDYGLWRSRDGGQTWEQASNGMNPNESVLDIVADPTRQGVLYAATALSGVFYTTDGGDIWYALNQGLDFYNVHYLALSAEGAVLYAGTSGRGVYRLGTPNR